MLVLLATGNGFYITKRGQPTFQMGIVCVIKPQQFRVQLSQLLFKETRTDISLNALSNWILKHRFVSRPLASTQLLYIHAKYHTTL